MLLLPSITEPQVGHRGVGSDVLLHMRGEEGLWLCKIAEPTVLSGISSQAFQGLMLVAWGGLGSIPLDFM